MIYKILLFIALVLPYYSIAQSNIWLRYTDKKSELSGYKDLEGNIKIPAKFEGFTRADTFYNIIAVDEINQDRGIYYLLKSGRKVGFDSMYVFDFTFDCESEGKIRFRDYKNNKVGFFDKNGVVAIPAQYDYVSPFYNGLSLAHIDGKMHCWDKVNDSINCEHWGWTGGELLLINKDNKVLVRNWRDGNAPLNWYSMSENTLPSDTNLYFNIKGVNGKFYSFLNYEKEFQKWFFSSFLPVLKSGSVIATEQLLFPEINRQVMRQSDYKISRKIFSKENISELKKRFENVAIENITISEDVLHYNNGSGSLFSSYYDACGTHCKERYPLFDVIINHYKPDGRFDYQEHFEFLRTDSGYRLIAVSLK